MNLLMVATVLAVGQTTSDIPPPPSTAFDGVWTVVALEINGRPAPATEAGKTLAIRNNSLTMPGLAAIHGTIRLDLGPRGTLRAIPAATGTGGRRDPSRSDTDVRTGSTVVGTSGTGVIGGATGVYVRTADYLVLTIGDPSAATATGTGVGETVQPRSGIALNNAAAASPIAEGTVATVGQPPVSLVLRRATGADAAPATAAPTPPAVPPSPAEPAAQTTAPSMRRSSSVVGSKVMLSDGSTAGPIEDIVYDNSGMINYAVLATNGTFAAVPWSGLAWDPTNRFATLPLTRDQFGIIPTFGANAWSSLLANPDFSQRLHNTFGNFRDAGGRPLFTTLTNRAGQMGTANNVQNSPNARQPGSPNQQNNQPGAAPTTRPGTQPGTQQPASPNQRGTQPGQPGAQPGGQPNVPPKSQPGPKPGSPTR